MSRKSLIRAIKPTELLNENFLKHITGGIAYINKRDRKPTSQFYHPSSLICMRNMFYARKGYEEELDNIEYGLIGCAETGTARHDTIQTYLIKLNDVNGSEWKYVDVGEYIELQKHNNNCKSIEVTDKRGNETHLLDNELHLSFMCDGILWNTKTQKYYLFEFKNQTSFKAKGKTTIDVNHLNQVICYCLALNLDSVIMLYENRDICELYCPPVVNVSDSMKEQIYHLLINTEDYVEKNIVPHKALNAGACKYCKYKKQCDKDGD